MRRTAAAVLLIVGCLLLGGCVRPPYSAIESDIIVGPRPAIELERVVMAPERPQFTGAEILPGRGMSVHQIWAHLPGRQRLAVLADPPIEEAARLMDGGPEDSGGEQTYRLSGAILAPFTGFNGRSHGLILASRMDEVLPNAGLDFAEVRGVLHAGDFFGHWRSRTDLTITARLRGPSFELRVVAKNAGEEPLPIEIGWRPRFAIPSGRREQVRLRLPVSQPELAAGVALGTAALEGRYTDLTRNAAGDAVTEIVDPAAHYGVRILARSPKIGAIEVDAPSGKNFVAIEPTFPKGTVTLQPGKSVVFSVVLEPFVP
jgi:aldose 1-epimerase